MDSVTAILAGIAAANLVTLCALCYYVARLSSRIHALTRITAESIGKLREEQALISTACLKRKDIHLLRDFLGLPSAEKCKFSPREQATDKI